MTRMLGMVLLLASALLRAGDVEGGADHPLVGRFQGADMIRYDRQVFDSYPLLIDKVSQYGGLEKNQAAIRRLEGKLTRITYRTASDHSTLEVLRAYREALAGKGFEFLFDCENAACGGRNFNHASPGYQADYAHFGENYQDQRYLAAWLSRPQGPVFVAVHVARNSSSGGTDKNRIFTQVDVLEEQPRQGKVVVLKADEMAERIDADGRVALYGLYFNTDSATLQAASRPSLQQVAALLASRPKLQLLVVGHTDNQGEFDYNMDLSRHRAAAVVDALTTDYGIAASRLTAWGVGFVAPAASNADEAGRARNRRVELVPR